MADPIKIDIWSDIACPWCYIGKRRLEAALKDFDGTPVEIEYHSFELDPSAPADYPGTHAEYLARHLGASDAQVRQMDQQITGLAAAEGLDYHLDDIKVTNTGKAHELIQFAKAQGKGAEMKERLMRAYFSEARHVGHDAELADLAAEIGLDRDAALQALTSGPIARRWPRTRRRARRSGCRVCRSSWSTANTGSRARNRPRPSCKR